MQPVTPQLSRQTLLNTYNLLITQFTKLFVIVEQALSCDLNLDWLDYFHNVAECNLHTQYWFSSESDAADWGLELNFIMIFWVWGIK